ncbi:MAG: YegS/Rv2252/BmrU family lipid kinase, partial [Oscillospiraceae bacterium]|nr:YegS/Rv2252/BmrU family lipid kinase [Oscillospiraceae bacterium]
MKHLFIINPAAGSRDRTAVYSEQIHKLCKGLDYAIEVSGAPGQCREIARKAAQSGEEIRIYSCGGDGTMNEIVSGVAGYPNVAVTMYSGGSGNDFARVFDDPDAFRDLERLLDAEEVTFDLIRCNDDYSLNICSVGFDARIGTDVANYKRLPLLSGFRAYAASAVVNTIRGVKEHYVVEIDGERIDDEFTLICACNGRYYGGGFNPVPEADPADGKLEVLLVKGVSRLQVAKVIGVYKNGKYATLPQLVRRVTTDRVKIYCDKPSPLNLDGELRVSDVADIRLAEEKIRFFYPKGLVWQHEKELAL